MEKVKRIAQKACILIGLNIAYFIFLAACFLLPAEPIVKNVEASLEIYADAKDHADNPVFDKTYTLYWDTFSDMIWVNMATVAGGNPVMQAVRLDFYAGGEAPWDNLVRAVYYRDSAPLQSYSRYWNVNVGVLKILYSFFTISDIRFLLYWTVLGLLVFLLYRMLKLQGGRVHGCLPVIAAFMMTSLELHAMCLSFFGDIFLTLVFMIALTWICPKTTEDEAWRISLLFMILGSVTYAIGPMVAPVMTVGMCLVLWVQLQEKNTSQKVLWMQTVINTIWWIAGYGVTVLAKQIAARLVIGEQDGIGEALMWFGADMGIRDRIVLLGDKLVRCFTPAAIKVPCFLVLTGILVFCGIRKKRKSARNLQLAWIALYPVLWVLIVSRHSIHYFTSSIFAVSFYAVTSILMNHISEPEICRQADGRTGV